MQCTFSLFKNAGCLLVVRVSQVTSRFRGCSRGLKFFIKIKLFSFFIFFNFKMCNYVPTNVAYNRDQLINMINQLFETTVASNGLALANGTVLTTFKKGPNTFIKMRLNLSSLDSCSSSK